MSSKFRLLVQASSSFNGWTDGQGVKQFRGRCLIVGIFGHPVQNPGVNVISIACDMQGCIELKNEFFIPIANIRAKVEEACVMKHTED